MCSDNITTVSTRLRHSAKMSLCKFKYACTNAKCTRQHPDGKSLCTFKNACTNTKCTNRHPDEKERREKLCHYDTHCTDKTCIFRHTVATLLTEGYIRSTQIENCESSENKEETKNIAPSPINGCDAPEEFVATGGEENEENELGELLGIPDDRVYHDDDQKHGSGSLDYSLIFFNGQEYVITGFLGQADQFSSFEAAADWIDQKNYQNHFLSQ